MINRAFIETMIEGDAQGRGFQYPIPTYSITKDFDWSDTENNRLLFEMTAKYGTPYFSNYINSNERLVRDNHLFAIEVGDGGGANTDFAYRPREGSDSDRIPNAHRTFEQNDKAGDKVTEDLLQTKTSSLGNCVRMEWISMRRILE